LASADFAFDIDQCDRRDADRLERCLDACAVADDNDTEVIEIDVLFRHAQDVCFCDVGKPIEGSATLVTGLDGKDVVDV
jgi:hypothetical protein